MEIDESVFKKILEEEKKYWNDEFGGYVIVKENKVTDVVFDVAENSAGYVRLGMKELLKVRKYKRKNIKGWFHKHPITGLSSTDMETIFRLTKFWGECITLVLQSDRNLLMIKTAYGRDIISGNPALVTVERKEIPIDQYASPEAIKERERWEQEETYFSQNKQEEIQTTVPDDYFDYCG